MPIQHIYLSINEVLMFLLLQLKKFVTTFLLLTVFISVPGCGGGSGGGSGSGSGGEGGGGGNAAPSNNSSSTIQAPPQSLNKLRIPRENELSTVAELNVEVQINASKSFLSICDIPDEELDVDTVNYESCVLRTPIANNLNTFKIMLPNHIDSLVAIVWFYETGRQPLVQRWQRIEAVGLPIDSIWRVHG
jgi:hypothetical protein